VKLNMASSPDALELSGRPQTDGGSRSNDIGMPLNTPSGARIAVSLRPASTRHSEKYGGTKEWILTVLPDSRVSPIQKARRRFPGAGFEFLRW